jgi:oligopeptide/dipeptide ABC transporter ATP-binding protein
VVSNDILLTVAGLKKHFPARTGALRRSTGSVKAVDGVSFHIHVRETLGLVGESGCGKTTTGRLILRLIDPTAGRILFKSTKRAAGAQGPGEIDVTTASRKVLKALRREMQIIFQDPFSSLNPRMTVGEIVGEPLLIHRLARGLNRIRRVCDILDSVGLTEDHMRRYPHEFSAGQRQRIGIARALVLEPRLVVCDEPVSALDVSIQAQVLNLLADLQHDFGLTYLFIAHDLSVVRYTSDRVAVMYLGKIVELAETEELFVHPMHPYSEALMSAVPIPDPDCRATRILLEEDVPSPVNPPGGCSFHPRCWHREPICAREAPEKRLLGGTHYVACHVAETLQLRAIQSE